MAGVSEQATTPDGGLGRNDDSSAQRQALKILQVSTAVQGGGAERVATDLHLAMTERGHETRLAVGSWNRDVPNVMRVPIARATGIEGVIRSWSARLMYHAAEYVKPLKRVQHFIETPSGSMRRRVDRWRGREALEFPGTRRLIEVLPWVPDVVHCHNLHVNYFDLRVLPSISQTAPLMLTLHDEWLYTGHCAYSLGCERWRTGCGECPDLTLYPAIERDGTAVNRQIKRSIYEQSSFYVSAPSEWLIERARASILSEGAVDFRVIRNGVDRAVFNEKARAAARARLGISRDARVLLFIANRARSSPYKDHETVSDAAEHVGRGMQNGRIILISLGEAGPIERVGNTERWQLPYETDPHRIADLYRSADLYLHAAHAEAAGLTILEALSCGTPVVATAVGGIPEQVHSLAGVPGGWNGDAVPLDVATGVLVPQADAGAMAAAVVALLGSPDVVARLARNGIADVVARFTFERQVDEVEAWYREACRAWQAHDGIRSTSPHAPESQARSDAQVT